MKNKILAAFTACAVIMSFSGCGEDTENISDINSMTQSTNSETEPGVLESGTSDLTGSDSETSDTDKQEQLEKIPMADEELDKMFIGPYAINFFKQYEQAGKEFDFTVSIDNVELLTHILDRLTGIIEKDDADDYELIPNPEWDWDTEYYYFKPETAEKLIQEYFLPTFKISSVDYTKSWYWDSEKKQFKVSLLYDGYIGGRDKSYYYLKESGYKAGDYYYVSLVPLADYPNAERAFGNGLSLKYPEMSYITSEYFDIPRVLLKFKKFTKKNAQGESWDIYIPVGFKPVDERPDWVKTAAKLFKNNDLGNVEMVGQPPNKDNGYYNMPPIRTVGVLSTSFGKRMYLYEKNYHEGTTRFSYDHTITTFGTRGQNDKIVYSMFSFLRQGTGGSFNQFSNITESILTCNDIFSGKKYVREFEEGEVIIYENGETVNQRDIHEESWKLNDKDISESEFNSAEVVSYFIESIKGNGMYELYTFDSLYSCKVEDCITLANFYEICRVIAD